MGDRDQRRRRPTGAGGDNRLGLDPAAPLAADSGDRHALSLGDLLETVAEVAVAADHDPVTGTGVVDHRRLHRQGPRAGDDVDPGGGTAADTRTDAVLHATHRRRVLCRGVTAHRLGEGGEHVVTHRDGAGDHEQRRLRHGAPILAPVRGRSVPRGWRPGGQTGW